MLAGDWYSYASYGKGTLPVPFYVQGKVGLGRQAKALFLLEALGASHLYPKTLTEFSWPTEAVVGILKTASGTALQSSYELPGFPYRVFRLQQGGKGPLKNHSKTRRLMDQASLLSDALRRTALFCIVSVYQSICLFVCLFIYLSMYLSVYLSNYLSISLSICVYTCTCVCR